jgi:hypothetical protein
MEGTFCQEPSRLQRATGGMNFLNPAIKLAAFAYWE